MGEQHHGGFAELARVSGDWLVPVPKGWTPADCMAVGVAGYTAMLCVMALEEQGVKPADGEVLVTGAAGGVGTMAIVILAQARLQGDRLDRPRVGRAASSRASVPPASLTATNSTRR